MKLRYTVLIGILGLVDVYFTHTSIDVKLIVLACCVLYALRRIEHQVGHQRGAGPSPQASGAEDWLQLRDGSWVKLAGAVHPYKVRFVREVSLPTGPKNERSEAVIPRLFAE